MHGLFVAGVLPAKRGSVAPAICSNCTLLVRPIFARTKPANGEMPSATPRELAQAILDGLDAKARVLSVSAAIAQPAIKNERALEEGLDQAARSGAIIIAAAGNQGTLGSTAISRHSWVLAAGGGDRTHTPEGNTILSRARLPVPPRRPS
jgi:subtilisin family serine protease